jgi:hypothetical protein
MLFKCNIGYTNAPHFNVMRTLPVLFIIRPSIYQQIKTYYCSEYVWTYLFFNVPTTMFLLMYHIQFWLEDADVFSEIFPVRLEISRTTVRYSPTCCCWMFTLKISANFIDDNKSRCPSCEADVVQFGKRFPVLYKSIQSLL